jgi:hypothetical protein
MHVEATAQERLKERLESLYAELPDDEKELLIITLALAGGSEVEGFGVFDAINNSSQQLQSQDKLGNTKIQTLMSNYNEAQSLMSSVLKKSSDAQSAMIGKI